MFVINTRLELRKKLAQFRSIGTIGCVPTMGALHNGHLSLVKRAASENTFVTVSIFVNPAQFNDSDDLKGYPRNLETDIKMLEKAGCHLVFVPSEKEIYPEPDNREFDFEGLDEVMEGRFRKGHFNGVAQVVSILFDLFEPHRAYFGQKDFQQYVIIKRLVEMLQLPIEIVPCPIVREKNGLAMSSRNELLSAAERENAAIIYKILKEVNNQKELKSVQELKKWVVDTINKNPLLNVEYFEIVNYDNLQSVNDWDEINKKVACIAVYCGKVRLIDNYVLN